MKDLRDALQFTRVLIEAFGDWAPDTCANMRSTRSRQSQPPQFNTVEPTVYYTFAKNKGSKGGFCSLPGRRLDVARLRRGAQHLGPAIRPGLLNVTAGKVRVRARGRVRFRVRDTVRSGEGES